MNALTKTKLNFKIGVSFNLRTYTPTNKLTPIRCVAWYDNNKVVLPSVAKVEPRYWNKDACEARNNQRHDGADINATLKQKRKQVEDIFHAYTSAHRSYPAPDTFRQLVKAGIGVRQTGEEQAQAHDLISFTEKFIHDSQTGVRLSEKGTPIVDNTLKVYRTFKRNLIAFKAKHNYDLSFDNVRLEFFEDFKEYMTLELQYATNTIAKHIKTVKTLVNEARELGLTTMTFNSKRYKAATEATDTIYLGEAELEVLYNLDLSHSERLDRVRDLFLVGCWTGLRFSDFNNIQRSNIEGDYINIKTQKTGRPVTIPIHPYVLAIMKKYEGKTENSLPPPISNQKLNDYIKEVCEMKWLGDDLPKVNFNEVIQQQYTKGGKRVVENNTKHSLVCSHTARRSFATNMYKAGVPTLTIMAITGHTTESNFMKYIRLTPMEHAQKLRDLWNKPTLRVVNFNE